MTKKRQWHQYRESESGEEWDWVGREGDKDISFGIVFRQKYVKGWWMIISGDTNERWYYDYPREEWRGPYPSKKEAMKAVELFRPMLDE